MNRFPDSTPRGGVFLPKAGGGWGAVAVFLVLLLALWGAVLRAESPGPSKPDSGADPDPASSDSGAGMPDLPEAAPEAEARFPVRQIRVRGANVLEPGEIEAAVYPYLGPGRTLADLERARAALEKAHRDKGYQTVAVEIPKQNGTRGIIYMDVVENKVGRLRVRGARFFLPSEVKRAAPSLREGTVPDFNAVQKDIVALNKWPDRRVTPLLRPGTEPGTVDVDLNVEDTSPLHGSVELNNRYSPDTTEMRLNASVSYNNLWQLGHSLGLAAQLAPERVEDAEVYSGYYIARFAGAPDFSLLVTATKQNSDVSTLGGAAVAGRGQMAGARAMFSLPERGIYTHSLGFGMDYKHFDEDTKIGAEMYSTPIDYYPFTVSYGGSWTGKKSYTEINGSVNFSLRGLGSKPSTWDDKRYDADGAYIFFRGDASHLQDLPWGFQAYAKVQGQASNDPLVNSEQYAGGGQSNARGYLESETLGDSGIFGTLELRSPSILPGAAGAGERKSPANEWRLHGFVDAGRVTLTEALPEQTDKFDLASIGIGSRLLLMNHLNGTLDLAWPLVDQTSTKAGDPFLCFRLWADF